MCARFCSHSEFPLIWRHSFEYALLLSLDAKTWEDASLHLEKLYSEGPPLEVRDFSHRSIADSMAVLHLAHNGFSVLHLKDFLEWRDLRVMEEILWYG